MIQMISCPYSEEVGKPRAEQYKEARYRMLGGQFSDYETEIREHLGGMLSSKQFNFDRDVASLTVNRWAHGYGGGRRCRDRATTPRTHHYCQLRFGASGRCHWERAHGLPVEELLRQSHVLSRLSLSTSGTHCFNPSRARLNRHPLTDVIKVFGSSCFNRERRGPRVSY